jgi:hypothetical protein
MDYLELTGHWGPTRTEQAGQTVTIAADSVWYFESKGDEVVVRFKNSCIPSGGHLLFTAVGIAVAGPPFRGPPPGKLVN